MKSSKNNNWLIILISVGVGLLVICIIGGIAWYVVAQRSSSSESACSNPTIKGNISQSGEKIYHKPGDKYYYQTEINESAGEKLFCTENEAQQAGWRHSKV